MVVSVALVDIVVRVEGKTCTGMPWARPQHWPDNVIAPPPPLLLVSVLK